MYCYSYGYKTEMEAREALEDMLAFGEVFDSEVESIRKYKGTRNGKIVSLWAIYLKE